MSNINWKEKSEFKEAEESTGFLLWQTSYKWRRNIEACLKTFELTHPQFVILACTAWLTRDNKQISQVEIAKQSKIDIATTSQVIRGLEKKGFIQRNFSETDERAKYTSLTENGEKLLGQALPEVEKIDREFFASLKEDACNFNKLLLKLLK
jgi:DNA-binding MarR family transcriptional regulator